MVQASNSFESLFTLFTLENHQRESGCKSELINNFQSRKLKIPGAMFCTDFANENIQCGFLVCPQLE